MSMLTSIIAAGILCTGCASTDGYFWNASMEQQAAASAEYAQNPEYKYKSKSKTGAYLSSRIARMENNWEAASYFFDDVIDAQGRDIGFRYQAMIMAMNAGRYDESIDHAEYLVEHNSDNALSYVIASMGAISEGDLNLAAEIFAKMPNDKLSELMKEPLAAWVYILQDDKEATAKLDFTKPFVAYQGIIAADVMNDNALVAKIAGQAKNLTDLSPVLQRHLSSIFKFRDVEYSEDLLKAEIPEDLRDVLDIREGLSWIYYDLAMPLYIQYQDETGRLLFNMALALSPNLTEARIRVAEYAAIHGRVDEAIQALRNVAPESKSYNLVQKIIAELLVDKGEIEPALDILNKMAAEQKDLSLYVQIGGIYAQNDRLSDALTAYNKALNIAAEQDEATHWQIFFARGRTYDAMGKWDNAEKDFLKALKYQPEQPFLLNYLGYSWADRGENLEEALKMIEQAVNLQPNDGSIRDSLGWVYYRLGDYKKAAHHLERAAALMPYDPVVNDHLGDAYWKVGRRSEAEFQWKRALNNAEDEKLTTQIEEKLSRY